MNYIFKYKVKNFTQQELNILKNSFSPNIKQNAIKGKNTLDSVIYLNLTPKYNDLEIDMEVLSYSDEMKLRNSIHGGLGKALGKGRVERR